MKSTLSTLVGRETELEALTAVVRTLAEGDGGAALIEGEPGIGKTRLLEEVVARAVDLGAPVYRGRARELEQDLPFALICDALGISPAAKDPVRSEVAALLASAEAEAAADGRHRFRILGSITGLIERTVDEGPALLVLDDLQWADASTLLLVSRLASRVAHLPLGIVCTARPYPRSRELEEVAASIRSAGGLCLKLAPLTESEVSEVARASLGANVGPNLGRELTSTGGNPLFVLELLAAVTDEGQLIASGATVDVATTEAPPSLGLTILRRLSFLPRPTVEAMRLAAVLGSVFDAGDLAEVVGIRTSELAERLVPALDSNLIVESEHRLAFRHDLVQAALYDDLPESVRRGMHRDVARSLAAGGRPAGVVAFHVARGAPHGDAEAVGWLRRAAAEAAPKEPAVAVEQLERAIELAGPGYAEMDDLQIELARTLTWSGRPVEGQELADRLLSRIPAGPRARSVRMIRLEALSRQANLDASIGELEAAARDESVPEQERVRQLAAAGRGWAQVGELGRARSLAEETLTIARRIGDVSCEVQSLVTLAMADQGSGFAERSIRYAKEAVEAELRLDEVLPVRGDYPFGFLAGSLSVAERYQEAFDAFDKAEEHARRTGNVIWQTLMHNQRGVQLYFVGRWDDAIAECETAITLGDQVGFRAWGASGRTFIAKIAVHRGDLESAERWMADAEGPLIESDWPALKMIAAHGRSALLEARGDTDAALETLRDAYQIARRTDFGYFALRFAPDFVRLALGAGDRDEAEDMTRIAEEASERMGTGTAQGQALLCRGLVAADAGILLRSVEAHTRGARVIERAWASEHAADQLILDGRQEEAIPLLAEAADVWKASEAARELARVESTLRRLGVRRQAGRRRTAARMGWESLTDTERRVVELVGEGLFYREIAERMFISRRTVETHVTHVFQKLGVSTRRELVAELGSRSP